MYLVNASNRTYNFPGVTNSTKTLQTLPNHPNMIHMSCTCGAVHYHISYTADHSMTT